MLRGLIFCLFAVTAAACTTYSTYDDPATEVSSTVAAEVSPDEINEVIEHVDRVAEREQNETVAAVKTSTPKSFRQRAVANQEPSDEISETLAHMPVEINGAVKKWIEFFTVKSRDRFAMYLERGEKYRPMIQDVLRDQGLPSDLYYLALIESGFATRATSRASAVGIWQFIAPTGKRYGLRVDNYIDERRDPMRSSVAASIYLKDLHNVFQSWYLSMAAYNAGESRIMNAIMNGKSRNFWDLVKAKKLPEETMNYIPKFLAAVIIGHNPEHYGFKVAKSDAMPDLMLVKVPSPIKLIEVARITKIPYSELKEYNPQIRGDMTSPLAKSYGIWVLKGKEDVVADNRNDLIEARYNVRSIPAFASNSTATGQTHRVRKGENLALISQKYGLPASRLRQMNNLKSSRVYAGMNLKVAEAPVVKEENVTAAVQKYRVRHGDNLHKIARQFKVSIDALKQINRLKRNTVYVGQVLRIADRG